MEIIPSVQKTKWNVNLPQWNFPQAVLEVVALYVPELCANKSIVFAFS